MTMEKKTKTRGLGRGLSALMADVEPQAGTSRRPDATLPIDRIYPNPDQPRRSFTPDQLEELAASIREKGVIQPLIVRPRPGQDGDYEIVAGERRWRAAQMAQLHEVPVVIRDFDDTEVLEIAIVENIQRADLNPVEEAAAFRALMDRFGHTQEKLSTALGKSRSYIANILRLLTLPAEVQAHLREGRLSAGHARALITAEDPVALAQKVIAGALSVRQTEALAKKPKQSSRPTGKPSAGMVDKDADTRAIEGDLSAALRMGVQITHDPGGEGGRMTIRYSSLDQLDELCMRLSGGN